MTSDPLVVDASAGIALVRQEAGVEVVRDAISLTIAAGGDVLVPELFWLEVMNGLVRRHRLPPPIIIEALRDLDEVGIRTVALERPVMLLAIDAAVQHGLSLYDASYLALAIALDGRLLTLDARLAAAAGEHAVPIGGTAREESVPYGVVRGLDWRRHGRYLAELRAREVAAAR